MVILLSDLAAPPALILSHPQQLEASPRQGEQGCTPGAVAVGSDGAMTD